MCASGQEGSRDVPAPKNRLEIILLICALAPWLFMLILEWVGPGTYRPPPSAPGFFDVAQLYFERSLFCLFFAAPLLVILFAAYRLLSRRSRSVWILVVALGLSSTFVVLFESIGLYPNVGLPFGYYGKLNLVVDALEEIPGLEVVDIGMHKDMTLEDFWITIELDNAQEELSFEGASVRPIVDLYSEFSHLRDAT